MKLLVATQTAANRIQKLVKVFNILGCNGAVRDDYINFMNLNLIYFKFHVANNMWKSAEKTADEFISIDFHHCSMSNESSSPLDKARDYIAESLLSRVKDALFNKAVKTRISHRSLDSSNTATISDHPSGASTSSSEHVIDIHLKELVMPCGSNNEYLDCIDNGLATRYNAVDKVPNIYYISANVLIRLIPTNTLSLLFEVNSLQNMKAFLQQNNLLYEEISYDRLKKTNQLVIQVANIQIRFIARNQSLLSYWVENNNALLENTIKEIQSHHVTGDTSTSTTGWSRYDGTDCWHEFRYILRKQPHKFL